MDEEKLINSKMARQRHVWEVPFPEEGVDRKSIKVELCGQFGSDDIICELNRSNFRPNDEDQEEIERKWSEHLKMRPESFAGSIMRLEKVKVDDLSKPKVVSFQVQPASYDQYIGLREYARERGISELAYPLTAASALKTTDNQLVVLQKPKNLATIGGFAVLLDFFSEEEVGKIIEEASDKKIFERFFGVSLKLTRELLNDGLWSKMSSPIFRTAIREVAEETSLGFRDIDIGKMKMFALSTELGGMYGAVCSFIVETNVSFDRIAKSAEKVSDAEGSLLGVPLGGKGGVHARLRSLEKEKSRIMFSSMLTLFAGGKIYETGKFPRSLSFSRKWLPINS